MSDEMRSLYSQAIRELFSTQAEYETALASGVRCQLCTVPGGKHWPDCPELDGPEIHSFYLGPHGSQVPFTYRRWPDGPREIG